MTPNLDWEAVLWEMAERAYTAYREDAKGQSYNGRPIPEWLDVNPKIQRHWLAAISALARPEGRAQAEAAVNESLNRRPVAKTIGELAKDVAEHERTP
jgi:hypothetical protein